MPRTIIILVVLFMVTFLCCDNDVKQCIATEKTAQSIFNPNGDSELALLMREMYDDVVHMKAHVDNGTSVHSEIDHEKMLTAHATQPVKAASAEYSAYAKAYLRSYSELVDAENSNKRMSFNRMVDNCMACHQSMCPGPMVRIKKLQ